MGRSITYNYVVQIETGDQEGLKYRMVGAMRYKEAIDLLLEEARRMKKNVGYIWPQTKIAKKKINHDYLKINILENTENHQHYITRAVLLEREEGR